MGRLLAAVIAAALLAPAPAGAEPVALLDAPRAKSVALAGDDVVVGRAGDDGRVRVDAVPRAGGPARRLLTADVTTPDVTSDVWVVASPQLVAALVYLDHLSGEAEWRLYSGPPSGPLALRRSVKFRPRAWMPVSASADADRLLLDEVRLRPLGSRSRVLGPGTDEPVPWGGVMLESALSGERVAFVGSRSGISRARIDHLFVIARRTGAVEASAKLRPDEDIEGGDLDLAPDGRAVAAVDGTLLTVAPGVAPARRPGGFAAPRFSGAGLAALQSGRFDTRAPVVLDPGAPARALDIASADVEGFDADGAGAAWIANGCVRYAPRDSGPPAEPPAGPCPRAEVVHEEGDQVLRGRRLRVLITCIAAPASGCRGTALLGRRGRYGRGAFAVAAGKRRTIEVRVTDRGMRLVRRMRERVHEGPLLELSARVRDGRAHGTGHVAIDRVR